MAIAFFAIGIANSQTVVNVQTPTTATPNHSNPTPKDFSIGSNGLNPTYVWTEVSNKLQGVTINLKPMSETHIYLQKTNSRLAFHFDGQLSVHLEVKWDGGSWTELSNETKQHYGWFTPQFSGNNSIGQHDLDVRITLLNGTKITRKYKVKITEDCSHLYKDNFGNTCTVWGHSSGKKPLVLADGIDQGNTDYAELIRYEASNLADELINNDFSLWVLNSEKGAQDIESIAAMYASLVRFVSSVNSNQQVIAAGISMGGQASRWAVCEAEEHNRPLPITHWISFDSPHRGAEIDHDLQDFIFDNAPTNPSLNATASKQLLNYSPFDENGTVHNNYKNKRNNLNGGSYPQQCISIGVSFSNGLPNPHNNEDWLSVEYRNLQTNVLLIKDDFKVKNSWSEAGSYIPALTGNAETEYASLNDLENALIGNSNFGSLATAYIKHKFPLVALAFAIDLDLLKAVSVRSETRHPTFVSLKSALDMDENGNSPFCYTLYSNNLDNFSHHDRVPQDLVERVIQLLKIGTLNDIISGAYHNFAEGEIPSTNNSFSVFGQMFVNGDINSGSPSNPGAPPSSNSLFRLSTSCNTDYINIKNGAELNIGSDTRDLKGQLIIRKGTTLRLEAGSSLIINDNCKLIIESGAKIEIQPGVQIVLNGHNAVLEIRGRVFLLNNPTFAVVGGVNGLGKLIFHNDWEPYKPPQFSAPNGGKFTLNGENSSQVHLEIYGNMGLGFSYDMTDVEIKNTEILIDGPSTLSFLNSSAKMENVKVSPINGTKHGGIKAVNRWQHFRNVEIYSARAGITVFNNGYNGRMFLQNVSVSHSDLGIHVIGGCLITYNKGGLNNIYTTAFLGNGLLGNSGIRGVTFSPDGAAGTKTGLNVHGSKIGAVDIRKNSFMNFDYALLANDSRLDLHCNNIFFNQRGIITSNTHLKLMRNNVSSNDEAWIQHGGTYHIENGLNYFQATGFYFSHWNLATHQYKVANLLYVPAANIPQYFVPDAQNAWGKTPLHGHNPLDVFNHIGKDYFINSAGMHPPPEPIMGKLNQNNPLPFNYFSNTNPATCPEISIDPVNLGNIMEIGMPPPDMKFNTGIFSGWGGGILVDGNNDADLILNDLKDQIFDYNITPNLPLVVGNLSDIIFYPYQMSEIDEEALESVLMNSYYLMLESVSRAHGVSVHILQDSFHLFNTVANGVLTVIDDLIYLSQNNHFLWSTRQFELQIDKANIQRFIYELDNAQTTLNIAENYIIHDFQQKMYDKLSCVLEAEIAIRDSTTLPENIEIDHPCLFADLSIVEPSSQSMILSNRQQPNQNNAKNVTIYPNPASNELFVKLEFENTNIQYEIYNLLGNKVLSGVLKEGDSIIDINTLSTGMYVIKIKTNKESYSTKFIVVK